MRLCPVKQKGHVLFSDREDVSSVYNDPSKSVESFSIRFFFSLVLTWAAFVHAKAQTERTFHANNNNVEDPFPVQNQQFAKKGLRCFDR